MFSIVSKASWRNRTSAALVVAATVLSIGYPFAVYFARDAVSARSFVLAAVALVAVRVVTARSQVARAWRLPLLLMTFVLIASTLLDAEIADKAYPTLMSLAAALVFGWSLYHPPSLIETFARLRRPNLPPTAIDYCRKVTVTWTVWLVINAAIAATLAIWGSLASWTIWTGLLSYLAMGLLFAGEIACRYLILGHRTNQ
jgi:uncharacterized membrane protein